jgi:hypothetical protein
MLSAAHPPDAELLAAADWPAVLRQARQHGVDNLSLPWRWRPSTRRSLLAASGHVAPDSAPAAWRTTLSGRNPRALQRQRQLAELLAAYGVPASM